MHPYGFDLSPHEALSTRSKITFLMSALRKNRLQKIKAEAEHICATKIRNEYRKNRSTNTFSGKCIKSEKAFLRLLK